MSASYRSLLCLILPALGCPLPDDSAGTDSSDTDTTPATVSETGCYDVGSAATACPDPADVDRAGVLPATCGAEVISVDGAGSLEDGCAYIGGVKASQWCLYPITVIPPEQPCDYGRPLILAGAPRLAPLTRGAGWVTPPRPGGVDPARAERWARVALAEHASVASFARFALELLAFGAPAELVAGAHAAALDEVRHARLAFGLVGRHAGVSVGPGPLPLTDFTFSADLAAFAAATAAEGCVAETLSALQVAEARDRSTDPAEREVLAVLARDEARHAALAWQTLRWATEQGGDPVRRAVAAVFAAPPPLPTANDDGLLPSDVARRVILRGWAEVIAPAAAAWASTSASVREEPRWA